MANPQLITYLKTYTSQGHAIPALKQSLLGQGWSQEDIDAAVTEFQKSPSTGSSNLNSPTSRPKLIGFMGWIGLIGSALATLFGLAILVMAVVMAPIVTTVMATFIEMVPVLQLLGDIGTASGFVLFAFLMTPLLLGIFGLVANISLLKMKKLGWTLYMLQQVVVILLNVLTDSFYSFSGVILPILLIGYLWNKRELFVN
ncbi:MAG: hypothetical protein GOV01_00110 [Candidatus Altiarchaeota archaeon]|nr:hypothetical protein [Candidatus Altiarchaeota archaeon]